MIRSRHRGGGELPGHKEIRRKPPETRDELYAEIGLDRNPKRRKDFERFSDERLLGNARFCVEHGISYLGTPTLLTLTDLPLRYEVMEKLLQGRRPITPIHVGMSVNNMFDRWHLTEDDKGQLLDALEKSQESEHHITDAERGILELRFGLSDEAGEDHPHRLTELWKEHGIGRRQIRAAENKALLACVEPEFSGLRAYRQAREYIEHAVELEVPGYVLEAGVLREPRTAPSALIHQVKNDILDAHWDDIPAGVREAGREKLMQMSVSDIIRGVLKKKRRRREEGVG